jgi:hypothetical protein
MPRNIIVNCFTDEYGHHGRFNFISIATVPWQSDFVIF